MSPLDSVATLADNWKKILGAIVLTVGVVVSLGAWLDGRISTIVNEAKTELLVQMNLNRCAIRGLGPQDCDPFEGVR